MKRILPLILTAFALACSGPDYQDQEGREDASLASSEAQLASGSISANPTTVRINLDRTNTGTTNICWSVSGASTAEVWLSLNGQVEKLFARAPSGCQSATWITAGNVFEFRLYAETAHTTLLNTATVIGEGYHGGVCGPCAANYSCFCGDNVCRRNGTLCP
ncbi:hypothetical protein [Corallococcus llansteffanensis]|uniref:Tenascin-X n=1 Tax=Corallococcus llansteffanensis TaxID=2316731 RepID=A0A3A8PL05_9BACT|nr:hypothetical protein [Corallococcus llansteffanensis]RKH56769.1 hypothetical protein D7V93_19670 [Corallococcus llansteffanensis]